MSDFAGMEDLLQDFLQEASDLLSDVDNKLVDLEKTPDDRSLLNDIFRGFHTIKGGAGFLNASELVTLCHLTENLFDRLRNGQMQLNPENLGKVYVNISSKEGVIHAQLAASNEAVRAALETQVADLRQNLNQAGVKVDAVEVTVASHEFEKNLEQNQESEKQQGERQQEQSGGRRRNLNLSSLDGLSGLMTEEETLAAQMMRENGNSMDVTA